jgi:filamentous hemagglutinin family protein
MTGFCLLFPASSTAQIVPDETLPTNSTVTTEGNTAEINGGTTAGSNLFHSFSEFSLPSGEAAFNNAANIENIFSRITGSNASNINGLIRANGVANLFLLNPNGIIFGPNASLNLGGSFVGTTADRIEFIDGTEFSASDPQTLPVLTVSVPIGLGFTSNPGAINVRGRGGNLVISPLSSSPTTKGSSTGGLSVLPGKTLALVGGDLVLEGGVLSVEDGRIELGSVTEGTVSLNSLAEGWNLGYESVAKFQNIELSQKALVDASGKGTGSVQIQGANVSLLDGSIIFQQSREDLSSGSIKVNASESLKLKGVAPDEQTFSNIRTEALGDGNGANVEISTKKLIIEDRASIISRNFSDATGGNLTINAAESIQLTGYTPSNTPGSSLIISTNLGNSQAGDINIYTKNLKLQDGGSISSVSRGVGNSGDVTINVSDTIELINSANFINSGLDELTSGISSLAFNQGNAGNLRVDTSKLVIGEKAGISTSTFSLGNAGTIDIKTSEFVEISGGLISSSSVSADPVTQDIFNLPDNPTGTSGEVEIDTKRLSITDGGLISVRSEAIDGNLVSAGSVKIFADFIDLNARGQIRATTLQGKGGNIVLNTVQLKLDNNSSITATADGNGEGGNIAIDTDTLTAVNNSNIAANALAGEGGNISIKTQGVFQSSDSDITASSELGIDGEVNINTTIDFSSFEPISPEFILAAEALQGSCFAHRNSRQGSFVYGGAGGLPVSPSSAIDEESSLSSQLPEVQSNSQTSRFSDLGAEDNSAAGETVIYPAQTAQKWQVGEPIIEPTNLIKTADGRLLWVRKQVDNASSLICQ